MYHIRPTQTKRRKRRRKRRSPSNLAQDHYINKKEPTRSHPARTLPRVSPGPANPRREKKDLHKQQSASTLYIFPNDIVPPRSESVGHVDEATDELFDTLSVVTKSASSSDDPLSSRYLNTTKKERDRGLSFRR